MQHSLELVLGGPATAKPLLELLKECYRGVGKDITSEREDAFRSLLVDASAGRAYLLRYKGREVGCVLVSFQHSVLHGGRIAVIDNFYLSAKWQGLGLARWILRAVQQDLEAFGVTIVTAVLPEKSSLAQVFAGESFEATRSIFFKKNFCAEEESGNCTF